MSVPDRSRWRRLVLALGFALIASALIHRWPRLGAVRLLAQTKTVSVNPSSARPEENRFAVVTLIPYGELDEGLAFSIAKDRRVFVIERRLGNLKVFDPLTASTRLVATFPVN